MLVCRRTRIWQCSPGLHFEAVCVGVAAFEHEHALFTAVAVAWKPHARREVQQSRAFVGSCAPNVDLERLQAAQQRETPAFRTFGARELGQHALFG